MPEHGYKVKRRDVFATKVANWVLVHIASKEYCAHIDMLIRKGMAEVNKPMTSDEFLGGKGD